MLRNKVSCLEEEKKALALDLTARFKESKTPEYSNQSFAVGAVNTERGVTIPDFISFGDVTHIFTDPSDRSRYETILTSEIPQFLSRFCSDVVEEQCAGQQLDAEATLDSAMDLLRQTTDRKRKAEQRVADAKKRAGIVYEVFISESSVFDV